MYHNDNNLFLEICSIMGSYGMSTQISSRAIYITDLQLTQTE